MKESPNVFLNESKKEAEAAAAASTATGGDLASKIVLPSNGYEVRLKPDGTAEEADKIAGREHEGPGD